jgi:hypothetical protein
MDWRSLVVVGGGEVREWDVLGFVEKEQYKGTSLIDADL